MIKVKRAPFGARFCKVKRLGLLNREPVLRGRIRQLTLVVPDVDFAVWANDLICIGIDPFKQSGVPLGKILKFSVRANVVTLYTLRLPESQNVFLILI